ncbi:multi-pass transmembrane protein [Besnoitia besnoiti]|uniref:Multi-pass transmembrane protein n=1 Tax=Besnoitia besnoiti TaxID=94643 RepID=A0A2A9MNP0_BESBE|nr:multi-pass transmembrane protein [Besnoitia besnoiti]PFH37537.1 multi-pass transmembrane protein [Besnoitia besnoiti]
MYSLGVEGDETLLAQNQMSGSSRLASGLLMGQHTMGSIAAPAPVYTGEEENLEPSPRGEEHTPIIHFLTTKLLRFSLSLKSVSMALMCIFFLAFGGRWVFTFHAYPDMSNGFHLSMVVLMSIYLIGTIFLALFQAFVADDSKWTKGFRTGSKILSAAVTLDILAAMLRLVQYLYLYHYLSVVWWTKFNVSKSEWILFTVSNVMDGLSLFSYGWAFFYMEVYHDEGTYEELAWGMFGLFSVSGIIMILMVFAGFGAVFMLLTVAGAYATACYWAYLFEPLLDKWSPELHCRDINTDIMPTEGVPAAGQAAAGTDYYAGQTMSPHGSAYQPLQTAGSVGTLGRIGSQTGGGGTMSGYGSQLSGEENIPTHYDYSQLQQQVSRDVEMGVVNPNYQ